ncbi:MAG: DNA cytosine methyltransferase [Pirellulaceae bacterium]
MIECVDLFCGLGGLTHGLSLGGVDVAAGIDVDPAGRFPYEQNNSACFVEKDISTLSGSDLKAHWKRGQCTLLAGCAPCQSFSTYSRKYRQAGVSEKRRADRKWALVSEFARLIDESEPDMVTMENVPQLLDHAVFPQFLARLSKYHVWHEIVDCSRYGVPQTRKRLVLLASRLGPIALKRSSINELPIPTVQAAIFGLPKLRAGEVDPNDAMHSACKLSALNSKRIRASKPGGTWRDWPQSLVADCHRKEAGETYPSVYGRMEWLAPAPTITTQCFGYGNGRFGHPEQDRAITLREAAILQTFPRSYKFLPAGKRAVYSVMGRLIGNAVPVKLGEAIGVALCNHVRSSQASNT